MDLFSQSFCDDAVEAACKMLLEGLSGRQARFRDIGKNEAAYLGVPGAALKGRSNIPFDGVVMGGFIDTLIATETASPSFVFNPTREQDKRDAEMMTAAAERETADDRGAWDRAIQDARFLASLSGRGFLKPVFQSIPNFKADLMAVDHYDFVCENSGPRILDEHLYKFQLNIFRDVEDLKSGAADGFYDKGQVRILQLRQNDETYQKRVQDDFGNKAARLTGFGLVFNQAAYVGTSLFNLCEGVFKFRGRWVYMLFDPKLKTWVRCEPLENVIELAKYFPGRGPVSSFATHPHPFLFWSKAPADDIRPIAYTMKKVVNLTIDNFEKRVWDMRAYDPKIFRRPSQLLWKKDGLVRATLKQGQQIEQGIFQFKTEDSTAITINLTQWLDNFLGQKTGITADSQGSSKEDRVGILVSNLNQVSKRVGLANRSFKEALVGIGQALDYGFYEYLRGDYAVKLLGPKGAQWEETITRRTTEKDFNITVSDGSEDQIKGEQEAERIQAGLDRITKDPTLAGILNPKWRARKELKVMGLDDEEIRIALDTKNDADADVLAKAAQAISDCLEGKDLYEMHDDATSGFVQKILDFCSDNYPLIPPEQLKKMTPSQRKGYATKMMEHDKLLMYAMAHIPIAQKNAVRAAMGVLAARGATALPPDNGGGAPGAGAAPAGPGLPSSPAAGPIAPPPTAAAPAPEAAPAPMPGQ